MAISRTRGARIHIGVTAFHEAGHAVMALVQGHPVITATVRHDAPGNGLVRWRPPAIRGDEDTPAERLRVWTHVRSDAEARIRIYLAGPLAEAKALRKPLRSLGSRSDFEKADRQFAALSELNRYATEWPWLPTESLEESRKRLLRETRLILARPKVWQMVKALAVDLYGWGTLKARDIEETLAWAQRAASGQTGFDLLAPEGSPPAIKTTSDRRAA